MLSPLSCSNRTSRADTYETRCKITFISCKFSLTSSAEEEHVCYSSPNPAPLSGDKSLWAHKRH